MNHHSSKAKTSHFMDFQNFVMNIVSSYWLGRWIVESLCEQWTKLLWLENWDVFVCVHLCASPCTCAKQLLSVWQVGLTLLLNVTYLSLGKFTIGYFHVNMENIFILLGSQQQQLVIFKTKFVALFTNSIHIILSHAAITYIDTRNRHYLLWSISTIDSWYLVWHL